MFIKNLSFFTICLALSSCIPTKIQDFSSKNLSLEKTCTSGGEIRTNAKGEKYYEEARFKKTDINKNFYFIRHGQTDLNIHGIAPRDLDLQVLINEEGQSQAARAAKLLKNKGIKIIVASPLIRAKQTAEILNKELNVPIIYDNGLKEANWGIKEGENINKASEHKKLWRKGDFVPGAESLYLLQTRIHKTIVDIVNKYDNALIVGHSVFYGNLVLLLNGEYAKGENAVPYYFEPISDKSSKGLYKIAPLM